MESNRPRRIDWRLGGVVAAFPVLHMLLSFSPLTIDSGAGPNFVVVGGRLLFLCVLIVLPIGAVSFEVDADLDHSPSSRKLLLRPPGMHLRSWCRFWFSRQTFTKVVEPTIADLQEEWLEAHKLKHTAKARWICIRGYVSLLCALATMMPVSLLRWFWQAWKKTKVG